MLKGSWMRKRWKHWPVTLTAVCALLFAGAGVWAASDSDAAGAPRSRVFKFRHITSRQAQDTLTQLKIGSGYNALTADVLIVTGYSGPDLIKASNALAVLDRKEPVSVRTLMVGTEAEPLPPLDVFIAKMKTVAAGTLLEGPSNPNKPAIVDIIDNKLIAIASNSVLDEIEAALNEWQNAQAKAAQKPSAEMPAEPQPQPAAEQAAADAEPDVPADAPAAGPKLADVAGELFGQLEQDAPAADVQEPAQEIEDAWDPMESLVESTPTEPVKTDEPAEETTDSFLEDELLKTLADAEANARRQQEAAAQSLAAQRAAALKAAEEKAAAEKAAAEQAAAEQAARQAAAAQSEQPAQLPSAGSQSDENLLKMLAMLGQSQPQAQEQTPAAEPSTPEPAVADAQAQTEPAPLKAEIDGLRQQLARLEQMLANGQAASNATVPEKPAEPSVEIDPQVSNQELTVIDLPQEIELESLVDLVGKQLGLNYMYDKSILQNQKVQLKVHGGKIKVGETYDLLESVLRFKGFIMTRRNGLVTILRAADVTKAEPLIREPGEPIPPGEIIVSTVFHLSHIDVSSAEAMLKGMNLGSNFTKIADTNTLIVTDYAYRMSQIRQVLEMIDVKGEMKEYKFRTLKYLKPSELVPKLKELAGQLQGVSLQISTGAPAAAQATRTVQTRDPRTGRTITQQVPITTSTPSAGGAAQPDAVFIDTDDRTNRVLVAGKHGQIELINELIDALDVPQYDLKYVREYIIQYVEAVEVVNVLNGLGLASVSVSMPQSGSTQQTGRMTAAQARAQAQGQPVAAQVPQVVQSAAAQAGGAEQPYISIRPATNSLLVNANAEQHKAIELVIAHVDVIQKDQRTIRQYEIQHVDTQEILETLTSLGIVSPQSQTSDYSSRTTSGQTARGGRTMPQQQMMQSPEGGAAPMSLPTADGGSEIDVTADQPQISVLRATNSLLVYATPRQHDAIALVIAHADRVPEVASTPYVVYALENQDPLKLAEVLTKLIDQTVEVAAGNPSSPDSKVQVSSQTAARSSSSNVPTLEEEPITIIPDEESYSLIVYANKRNQQWISEMISELDEYRPQVLLDCTLVEITKDDAFNYSLNLIGKTYDDATIRAGSPVAADSVYGPFSIGDTLGDASVIAGNATAFLNTGSVQAVLTAMQQNRYGRIMAQPKLLVNDNQEGEIKTENKTSIAQQKSIIQPATGTSPSLTTTDVSFSEYAAGVTLKIKPHISKGDMLRLEVVLSRTDFTERDDVQVAGQTYPRPPDLLTTDVTTIATVPDGTTIVLGGLESVGQQKRQTKVPLLGDIPLVGALFRGVNNTDVQSKLYVFVKANVIRPGDQVGGLKDIRRVSKRYRDEFEDMEKRFQTQDDVPGLKPKPMQPLKVLEMDEVDDAEYVDPEYIEELDDLG